MTNLSFRLSRVCLLFLLVVAPLYGCKSSQEPRSQEQAALPDASRQEPEQPDASKSAVAADVEKYIELKDAAKKAKIEKGVEADGTGTDPRAFTDRWMPFYRYTKLENGVEQQDLTAFGTVGFNERVGMFFEVPLAQYRDFSGIEGGLPAGATPDAIGIGDTSLKFLWRPAAAEFTYGKDGKKSASLLLGTDWVLPTATNDALGGNALLFAPIVGFAADMPFHGFIAMLNLYYFDVYGEASAPYTSRYVGRLFYMQPFTKPGPWWGGLFVLPEFQPIYDFRTDDWSLWIGVEIGKLFAPGRIGYVKPGWGVGGLQPTDRDFTMEVGFRWFF